MPHLLPSFRLVSILVALFVVSLTGWWNFAGENKAALPRAKKLDMLHDFPIRKSGVAKADWLKHENQTCLKEGLVDYPTSSVITRMPYAIVIGMMKSGTSALSMYLYQHPQVVQPQIKELHFYDFQYQYLATADGIHRRQGRKEYGAAFQRILGEENIKTLFQNKSMVAIDDSPRYLLWSDRVPARILCISPWAKLLAVLRNPIDRAYSHYNMQRISRKAKRMQHAPPTFEEWVEMDMTLLKETGVIQTKIPLDQFAGSEAELEAWKEYTRIGSHCPIGRGLYALQLRHWFRAYENAGKNRSDRFFIIQSERLKSDKEGVYKQVLEFLKLEPYELEQFREQNTGHYSDPIKNETRAMLQEFYKPYNEELYKLLGKEWEGVWDS